MQKNIIRTYDQHGQLTKYTIDHRLFTTEMSRRGRRTYLRHTIRETIKDTAIRFAIVATVTTILVTAYLLATA